ncbi:hypothetical protein CsatB_030601 [Cannabis sativa]
MEMGNQASISKPKSKPKSRIPPKRGEVLKNVIKSFTKWGKDDEEERAGSLTPVSSPSGYASEFSGPLS